jgi:hypothetical protein
MDIYNMFAKLRSLEVTPAGAWLVMLSDEQTYFADFKFKK